MCVRACVFAASSLAMDGAEASSGGGAETGEEAMDVAMTKQENLIVTPDGTSTPRGATDTQSQDAHTPAAAAAVATAGDFII